MPDLILMVMGECFFIHELESIGVEIEKEGQLTYCPPHHHTTISHPFQCTTSTPTNAALYMLSEQLSILFLLLF
jgi:hypothetical protein